jgi:ADP-heptose:LPS heptosyltransferase
MGNGFKDVRQRFYAWRQLRPLQRFVAAILFVIAWPIRSLLFRISTGASTPRRIVVIQLAGLGDALMATPAVAALHERYPGATIDLITLHGYVKDAFQNHTRFNTITKLPAYPGKWIISRFATTSHAKLITSAIRYYPEQLLKSAFRRYDIGVNFALSDFDRNLGNALLYCLGVPVRVGAFGSNGLLNKPVQINYEQPRTAAYLQLLEPLGIVAGKREYEFPVQPNDVETVKLALRTASIDARRPLAVIQPGGKIHINSRRWPAEYFVSVCEFLATNEGFEIVLTGDHDDEDVCEQIALALGPTVKSLAGRLSFSESAALLSLSTLCITNDTSTLHLAEATKVPRVISIFGPTDSDILAPQNSRNIVFKSKLPCAPCMGGIIDGNTELCWRDIKEECLWKITPDQVIGVLKQLYESAPARVASA